jgi:hypothetical protein
MSANPSPVDESTKLGAALDGRFVDFPQRTSMLSPIFGISCLLVVQLWDERFVSECAPWCDDLGSVTESPSDMTWALLAANGSPMTFVDAIAIRLSSVVLYMK